MRGQQRRARAVFQAYFWIFLDTPSTSFPLDYRPELRLYWIKRLAGPQLAQLFDACGLRLTAGTRSGENPPQDPENGTFFF